MISIKTTEEIKIMRQAGRVLAQVLKKIIRQAKPGVNTLFLDNFAERLILQSGAQPAFKGYAPDTADQNKKNGYPATLCTSINNEVVHGLPRPDRVLQNGDIIGIDCGLKLKGYYADMAATVAIGKISPIAKKLMLVTKKSLEIGIKNVKDGVHLGDVSSAIQNYIEKNDFSVVRNLTGHGIGKNLHEDPNIFNFGQLGTGPILKQGMVLAVEPMVNVGDWRVKTAADGWTVLTADDSLSAHFEHTVLVTKSGHQILTKL